MTFTTHKLKQSYTPQVKYEYTVNDFAEVRAPCDPGWWTRTLLLQNQMAWLMQSTDIKFNF